MQGRQSCRASADAIHAAVHLIDGPTERPNTLLELRDIDCIAVRRARSHIMNLLTTH